MAQVDWWPAGGRFHLQYLNWSGPSAGARRAWRKMDGFVDLTEDSPLAQVHSHLICPMLSVPEEFLFTN
jgi:hypothetical protein